VLILNSLFALDCTKIVQNAAIFVSIANKRVRAQERLPESRNASKMLAARQEDVVISTKYYMPAVTVCQAKNASQDSTAVGDVIFIVLAMSSKPADAKPACAGPRPRLAGMGLPPARKHRIECV